MHMANFEIQVEVFLHNFYPLGGLLFALIHSGMLPHKKHRGKEALERLKVFEGMPPPYDKVRKHRYGDYHRYSLPPILPSCGILGQSRLR